MAVGRKGGYSPSPTVKESAILHIGRENPVFRRLPGPIDWQAHAAVVAGLEIMIDVSLSVIKIHDSLVAPKINRQGLEAGQVAAKIRDDRILRMADPVMMNDLALDIRDNHAFIAGSHQNPGFRFR